jgi:hypothetical protein
MLKDRDETVNTMKNQCTNSTFASYNKQADTSAFKRAIFLLSHCVKNKRTASYLKQPFQLANFCPFRSMTTGTRRKYIRIIIQSDYFSTFYAFVASLSGFFSCSVHKLEFKRLITRFNKKLDTETFLATFFCRTYFNFLCYSCRWSSCSLSRWDKLSVASISNSCRRFTHNFKNLINNYICHSQYEKNYQRFSYTN